MLKAKLLGPSMLNRTDWDDQITGIGLGVAKQFEHFCNRKFEWTLNDTAEMAADRVSFLLPRYPLETVSLLELQTDLSIGFVAQDISLIKSINKGAGIVYLDDSADIGSYLSTVRFTYSGGFWWDTTEDSTGVCPDGAKALEPDFILGWLMQCDHQWRKYDKLGRGISKDPEGQASDESVAFLPMVMDLIDDHRRYQLT